MEIILRFTSLFWEKIIYFESCLKFHKLKPQVEILKGTVMQNEKALIKDRLRVSKVSLKFCISAIYNFTVICR